jgi:sugar phosphate isomerase/epimerase
MFALSTAWGAKRTKVAADLIEEAKQLGFSSLELHHSLNATTVMEMLEAYHDQKIRVTSLHNFCPSIQWARGPDAYSLSSLDRAERSMAVKKTKATIDMAQRFDAEAVVMHLGRVNMRDLTPALIELYTAGLKDTRQFEKLKGKILAKRDKKRFRHLDVLYESLDELVEYSHPKGIKLGLENRYCLEEIPCFDEVKLILDRFQGSNLRYWHDVGHAQCAEELDVVSQEAYLRMYSDQMAGIHLHDVIGVSDHRVPLTGEFDFTRLKPYLSKDTIKVVEAFVAAPEDAVLRGMDYIRSCLASDESQPFQ